MKVLILYYSKTGHTREAAMATAEGIRAAGSEADVVSVHDYKAGTLGAYDGLILASPCWAGSVTHAGIARPLTRVVDLFPADCLAQKRCGAISVHAATGGQNTVIAMGKLLRRKGCKVYKPGPAARAGVPLSIWKGPSVAAADLERFSAYGAQFVA